MNPPKSCCQSLNQSGRGAALPLSNILSPKLMAWRGQETTYAKRERLPTSLLSISSLEIRSVSVLQLLPVLLLMLLQMTVLLQWLLLPLLVLPFLLLVVLLLLLLCSSSRRRHHCSSLPHIAFARLDGLEFFRHVQENNCIPYSVF